MCAEEESSSKATKSHIPRRPEGLLVMTILLHSSTFFRIDHYYDYGQNYGLGYDMQEIAISEFKAKCFSLLQQVRTTKQPIRVTRFGKPVADVVPPAEVQLDRNAWIGSGKGTTKILGDISSQANDPKDWEALRD